MHPGGTRLDSALNVVSHGVARCNPIGLRVQGSRGDTLVPPSDMYTYQCLTPKFQRIGCGLLATRGQLGFEHSCELPVTGMVRRDRMCSDQLADTHLRDTLGTALERDY
jgi:hypothetical protein